MCCSRWCSTPSWSRRPAASIWTPWPTASAKAHLPPPHVLGGGVAVLGTGEVLSNWEELKRKEKGQATNTDALEAVARSLPALWRAEKVQKKAKKAGLTGRMCPAPWTSCLRSWRS